MGELLEDLPGYLNQVVNHLIDELERLDRRMAQYDLMIRDRCVGTVTAKQAIVLRLPPSHSGWYIVSVSRSLPYAMAIIIALWQMHRQRIDLECQTFVV